MPISYLILSLTTRCNLKCRYCYDGDKCKTEEISEAIIEQAIFLAAENNKPFHLQLTGGEPTLTPNLIEIAAKLAQQSGLCHSMGIQTNGTLLTDDLLSFFKKNRFQVGISLDGPPKVQQDQRGLAAKTIKGLQRLEFHGIPFRVTTVVTQVNADHLYQLVLLLAGFSQARGIGLDLLVNKGRAANKDNIAPAKRSTLEKGLHRMLTTLDAVNHRRSIPIRLRERDLLSLEHKKSQAFCHACRAESLAVTPSGKIYPCGQTLKDPYFESGTVWKPNLKNFKKLHESYPDNTLCHSCELQTICPGDCPSRLHYNKHQNPPQVCDLYKILWQIEKNLNKSNLF